ncbi:hypothetical protein C5167_015737 [Papaver somniferum]|uniref:Uncharacterized protein n=1 Tax=Papaver somniferum TaxID=3469 RepID=A0A4Y7JBA0_PAPSO|nr:hypothetical protein C5167_015737 [Papaver somniferum]
MSLAEVHCVSTTKVHPASYIEKSEDGSSKRIDLNPWDLAFLRRPYMQRGLLFTKPQSIISKQEEEETNNNVMNNMISHLKTSLSNTLDHFYPLAGRLGIEKHEDDNKISVYINCNSEGAEFIHATADISIDNILSPIYTPQSIIDSFFTLHGVLNYEGQSHPLLSIQLWEILWNNYCVSRISGSIDIEICLPIEIFTAMEKDTGFMEAFSC